MSNNITFYIVAN